MDRILKALVELIDDIEGTCHMIVQYSEHATYPKVLSRHESNISGLITRIIDWLDQSDQDLVRMRGDLEDERLRITESL